MFADDLKLFKSLSSTLVCELIESELNSLALWRSENDLLFNVINYHKLFPQNTKSTVCNL